MKRPYRFVRLLARGGYGEVWVVRDAENQLYALKKLLERSPTFLESLTDEVKKLLRLRGTPGVVQLVDYDLDGAEPFGVMELADGTLLDLIKGPMDAMIAVGLAQHIVKVVRNTHRKGVLHRDIKPANILLKNGVVKLADFGLGKGADTLLLTIGGAGTPGYMAPEQRRMGPVFPPADVYGVGATIFHMLTGTPPPEDRSDLDPRWAVGSCPSRLCFLVRAMTATRPDQRPNLEQILPELQEIAKALRPAQVAGERPQSAPSRKDTSIWDLVVPALAVFGIGAVVASVLDGGKRRR